MLCSPPRRTPTAGSSGKNRNLTKILRLPSIIVIISLLATLSTVFGCEVLPGGQVKAEILTKIARLTTDPIMTLLLVTFATVFGCGVMLAGQDNRRKNVIILRYSHSR
ncbi:hypothetical protein KIN20_008754 [Parelaphostrongylus tenuis]|uniref:Uncharacterized protein n=1 Tax=Parelaphostrongylus tenuis TaxID=148309 RepID=A0AAD5QHS0_PARTN|nr:hypothetical protein KIN20_008754 [Parelaphostrongylus tenuis]